METEMRRVVKEFSCGNEEYKEGATVICLKHKETDTQYCIGGDSDRPNGHMIDKECIGEKITFRYYSIGENI